MHFVKWVIELTTRLTPYGSPGPRDESRCDSHRLCHMTRWLILMAPNRACQMSRSNDAWGAGHALRTGSGLPSSAGRRVFAPLLLCHAGCTSLKRFKGLGKREREIWNERGGGVWPRMREWASHQLLANDSTWNRKSCLLKRIVLRAHAARDAVSARAKLAIKWNSACASGRVSRNNVVHQLCVG